MGDQIYINCGDSDSDGWGEDEFDNCEDDDEYEENVNTVKSWCPPPTTDDVYEVDNRICVTNQQRTSNQPPLISSRTPNVHNEKGRFVNQQFTSHGNVSRGNVHPKIGAKPSTELHPKIEPKPSIGKKPFNVNSNTRDVNNCVKPFNAGRNTRDVTVTLPPKPLPPRNKVTVNENSSDSDGDYEIQDVTSPPPPVMTATNFLKSLGELQAKQIQKPINKPNNNVRPPNITNTTTTISEPDENIYEVGDDDYEVNDVGFTPPNNIQTIPQYNPKKDFNVNSPNVSMTPVKHVTVETKPNLPLRNPNMRQGHPIVNQRVTNHKSPQVVESSETLHNIPNRGYQNTNTVAKQPRKPPMNAPNNPTPPRKVPIFYSSKIEATPEEQDEFYEPVQNGPLDTDDLLRGGGQIPGRNNFHSQFAGSNVLANHTGPEVLKPKVSMPRNIPESNLMSLLNNEIQNVSLNPKIKKCPSPPKEDFVTRRPPISNPMVAEMISKQSRKGRNEQVSTNNVTLNVVPVIPVKPVPGGMKQFPSSSASANSNFTHKPINTLPPRTQSSVLPESKKNFTPPPERRTQSFPQGAPPVRMKQNGNITTCVAIYPYIDQGDGLSLSKGDVITINDNSDAYWWTGTLNGKTGCFPKNCVEMRTVEPTEKSTSNELNKQSWFGGKMDRANAEHQLKIKNRNGCFFIRETDKGEGYSMSLFHNGTITHLRVPYKDGGYFLGASGTEKFTTVTSLVKHYSTKQVTLKTGVQTLLNTLE